MRALTVRQPWAWALVAGGKDVENRSRNVAGRYRGPVAIHAGLVPDKVALQQLPALPSETATASRVFRYGAIIGVADLVDVHKNNRGHRLIDGCCKSEWAEQWSERAAVHLVFANPRPLPTPIPCRGALGLWTPTHDIAERVRAVIYG